MSVQDNRLIKGDAKIQKAIESLISAYTILMSKEPYSGINSIALTLMIIEDNAYQDMLSKFDTDNPLHVKARDILVELRRLNAMPIYSAYTMLLIGRIKLAFKQQQEKKQASKDVNITSNNTHNSNKLH